MTKSTLMSFLTGMVFFVMTWTTAMAHVSHIEPQAARNLATCVSPSGPGGVFDAQFCNDDTSMQTLPAGLDGSSPEEDFSFAHPFVMPKTFGVDFSTHHDDDGEEPDHPTGQSEKAQDNPAGLTFVAGLGPNIEISKAIHAYLKAQDISDANAANHIEGDVDWFQFELDADELSFGERFSSGITISEGTAMVSANALPWRCDAYKNSLPTIALIGPQSGDLIRPGNIPASGLPTEVKDALLSNAGWGIFVHEDTTFPAIPRRSSHFGSGINTDWWGGNPDITFFEDATGFQRFRGRSDNGSPLTIEGIYHLAVWDPNGEALDYTLSTGFWEQPTEAEDILGDGTRLLFDNDMLLDIMCSDPCDGSTPAEITDLGDDGPPPHVSPVGICIGPVPSV